MYGSFWGISLRQQSVLHHHWVRVTPLLSWLPDFGGRSEEDVKTAQEDGLAIDCTVKKTFFGLHFEIDPVLLLYVFFLILTVLRACFQVRLGFYIKSPV